MLKIRTNTLAEITALRICSHPSHKIAQTIKALSFDISMKMPSPRISIVVSCYNKGGTIEHCVTSILRQELDEMEVIVVDDGSTDDSLKILERLAAHSALNIISEKHRGISATKNKGFAASKADIVLFLDGDCILEKGSLQELAKSFEGHAVDCVGGEVRATNSSNIIAHAVELMQNEVDRKWPFGANVAYSRKALHKAGVFDEQMRAGEDAELYLRVMKLGFRSMMNQRVVARTRNPDNLVSFFRQRLNWGRGFRQLTERHPETFTRRIKLCFFWICVMLLSPLMALFDFRLIWAPFLVLSYNIARFTPGALTLRRRTNDLKHCALVPFLRFTNALAYFVGYIHWCILEHIGRAKRLTPFLPCVTVDASSSRDLPL